MTKRSGSTLVLMLLAACSGAAPASHGQDSDAGPGRRRMPSPSPTGDAALRDALALDSPARPWMDGGSAPPREGGPTPGEAGSDTSIAGGPLTSRVSTSTLTVPAGVKPGELSWRVWGESSLGVAPVYTVPLANCQTLVCYTTGTGDAVSGTSEAYVALLDAGDNLVGNADLGAFECRGLAAESDGHYAALLWAQGTATDCTDFTANGRMYVKRYAADGTASWSTELVDNSTVYPAVTVHASRRDQAASKDGPGFPSM